MPKLIAHGGHALEIPVLPCRIGTAESNEVPITAGLGVAGFHLTIAQQGNQFVIRDSGSGLGTFVNGQAITESWLAHGDSLRIGQLSLTFACAESSETASPGISPPPARVSIAPAASPTEPKALRAIPRPQVDSLASKLATAANQTAQAQQTPPQTVQPNPLEESGASLPTESAETTLPVKVAAPSLGSSHPQSGFPAPSAGDQQKAEGAVTTAALLPPGLSKTPAANSSRKRKNTSKDRLKSKMARGKATGKRTIVKSLLAVAFTASVGVGAFVLWKGEPFLNELKSKLGLTSEPSLEPVSVASVSATTSSSVLVNQLANAARPGAVVSVNLAKGLTFLQDEHSTVVPRLTELLSKITNLDLSQIATVAVVGGGLDDAVIALQFQQTLGKQALAASIQALSLPATDSTESCFVQDLLGWQVHIAPLNDSILMAGAPSTVDRLLTAREKKPGKVLAPNLMAKFNDPKASLVLHIDATLLDRANLPQVLHLHPNLTAMAATLTVGVNAAWQAGMTFTNKTHAIDFKNSLPLIFKDLLATFSKSDSTNNQGQLLATLQTTVQDENVDVEWSTSASEFAALTGEALNRVERELAMASGPPTREELDHAEREATRVAAIFDTAQAAGAALDGVVDVSTAIRTLQKGVLGTDQKWADHVFKVRRYNSREHRQVASFLEFKDRKLVSGAMPLELQVNALRNAQGLASVYAAAQAAGASLSEAINLKTALALLTTTDGVSGTGTFEGENFSYPLSATDAELAAQHLNFDNGQLIYTADPRKEALLQDSASGSGKGQRDASSLASIFTAAKQAGAKKLQNIQSLDAAVDQLTKDSQFSLSLTDEEKEAAKPFLKFEGNQLVYQEVDGE